MNTLEKEFVPYEQALALKELGFDEPCFANYTVIPEDEIDWFTIPEQGITDKTSFGSSKNYNSKSFEEEGTISAPTFSQAFRWFREKRDWQHSIEPTADQYSHQLGYNYWIWNYKTGEEYHTMPKNRPSGDWEYKSYEEAELACLIKLIEICR